MANEFQLQDGEEVIKELKPLSVLKWFFFIRPSMGIITFPLFLLYIFTSMPFSGFFTYLGMIIIPVFLVILVIMYLVANNKYNNQHYWVTNKRILYKRGLFGYTIHSIPLERVSDVIVSRTFWERVFGFGSVHVQSLAGQVSYGMRNGGAEGSLMAVDNPEGVQKLIFDLIKIKRKNEHLTM